MELVPAFAARPDEPGGLEDVEVLRDGLPRRGEAVLHRQPRADLEQRLVVAIGQLVEDRPPGGIGERPKDVVGSHVCHHVQVGACLSTRKQSVERTTVHAKPRTSRTRAQWKNRTATSTPNAAITRIAAAATDASSSPAWNSP